MVRVIIISFLKGLGEIRWVIINVIIDVILTMDRCIDEISCFFISKIFFVF